MTWEFKPALTGGKLFLDDLPICSIHTEGGKPCRDIGQAIAAALNARHFPQPEKATFTAEQMLKVADAFDLCADATAKVMRESGDLVRLLVKTAEIPK